MKYFIVIFFISMASILNAQELVIRYYDDDETKIKERFYVRDSVSLIPHGLYASYYLNGSTRAQGKYFDNKPHGIWKYYFEDGSIKTKGEYNMGMVTGRWQYFYENGNTKMKGVLVDSKKEDDWTYYYENGQIKSAGKFKKNKKDGIWNYFYEDGTLKGQGFYEKDNGTYKEFYHSGSLKLEGIYLDGKSDSSWRFFYESGELEAEGPYSNGLKNDYWKYYHKNGELASEGRYIDDKKVGNWYYYYPSGQLKSVGKESDGKKEGYWKLFYESGQLKALGGYEGGAGYYREYYQSGNIKAQGKIIDNKKEGQWTYYYEDGKKEGVIDYENGYGIYTGYYKNGQLKMRGEIRDEKRIGKWELFEVDGSLAGYYKPIYENEDPIFKSRETIADESNLKFPYRNPDYKFSDNKWRNFIPRINEYKGVIIGTSPFFIPIGRWPFSVEYYIQERLGYELGFTLRNDPLFSETQEVNKLQFKGGQFSFRQKFYYPERKLGQIYIGHQLAIEYLNHKTYIDPTESIQNNLELEADEVNYTYGLIFGNRWFQDVGNAGLTIDLFIGVGIGVRTFDKNFSPQEDINNTFSSINQNQLAIPMIFGLNIGYIGPKRKSDTY